VVTDLNPDHGSGILTEIFVVFLSSCSHIPEWYFKLRDDRFLPNPYSLFMVTFLSNSTIFILCSRIGVVK